MTDANDPAVNPRMICEILRSGVSDFSRAQTGAVRFRTRRGERLAPVRKFDAEPGVGDVGYDDCGSSATPIEH